MMSDRVALWFDKVQTALKNNFYPWDGNRSSLIREICICSNAYQFNYQVYTTAVLEY